MLPLQTTIPDSKVAGGEIGKYSVSHALPNFVSSFADCYHDKVSELLWIKPEFNGSSRLGIESEEVLSVPEFTELFFFFTIIPCFWGQSPTQGSSQ